MSTILLLFLSTTIAHGFFGPNVRIDRESLPTSICLDAAITVGPSTGSCQPLYVVFAYDSTMSGPGYIVFQKSPDAGKTWLSADVVVGRNGEYPDIATDRDGNIYVVYDGYQSGVHCTRSTDGGSTWSDPARVNDTGAGFSWARIAADSAGNLLCAWGDCRTGWERIWSSVSTDRGTTWSQSVRVDDDTVWDNCCQADVFVQPGTNDYLVAAEAPRPDGHPGCFLYRSTDMGRTFQPGVRLDTLSYASNPHVVADAQHVICDCTWDSTEARTWYTGPDTWGVPHAIGYSLQDSRLAISADGRVHTALNGSGPGVYLVYYASSSDHGFSWSAPVLVTDDTTAEKYDADIGADSAGHAYVVWRDQRDGRNEIWFSTNCPAGIAEEPTRLPISAQPSATVVRNFLLLPSAASPKPQAASLLDISGRQVVALKPGANDVSRLSPGVYFVKEAQAQAQAQALRKVVITK